MADPAEQNEQVAERPEWLPEKFESGEALAKSYSELERERTQLAERAKQADVYQQNYAELLQQHEQLQQNNQGFDASGQQEQLQASFEQDPMGTVAWFVQQAARAEFAQLQQKTQQQTQPLLQSQYATVADIAYRELEAQYPDAKDYQAQIAEMIQTKPWLYPAEGALDPQSAKDSIETVYQMVKGKAVLSGTAQAAVDTTEEKRLAQTAVGAGARPQTPDEAKAEWERVRNAAPQPYWSGT